MGAPDHRVKDPALQSPAWQQGVLDPHGPIAAAERMILLDATVIMLAVIVPVIVLTLTFAWWFRAGNKWARRDSEWAYSGAVDNRPQGHRVATSCLAARRARSARPDRRR